MNSAQLVARVNTLPYPPTVYSHNWIYGVWYCGTAWQKSVYYGQYPSTLVRRLRTMFGDARILHLCCGRCRIPGAVNVDLHALPEVDVQADAEALPFSDASFDVVLIDPPYSDLDAERYKVPRLVSASAVLRDSRRVLRPGGWLLWLDERYPSYRRDDWHLRGLIAIVTGFERRTRVLSMFQVNGAPRQMPLPMEAAR